MTPDSAVASSTRLVFVDLAPIGAVCPPPLVSWIAVHAGAFGHGTVNVIVQVAASCPSVTLPAASDPTIIAPPQSAPGVAANDVPGQSSSVASTKRRAVRAAAVLTMVRCIILLLAR